MLSGVINERDGFDGQAAVQGSSSEEGWQGLCWPRSWKGAGIQICWLGALPRLPPGRERGTCWDPILGGPRHPATPVFSAFHVVIYGLFQQKSKTLPEKSLPHLALAVP